MVGETTRDDDGRLALLSVDHNRERWFVHCSIDHSSEQWFVHVLFLEGVVIMIHYKEKG
jgi:hypothetical protein